MQKSDSNNSSKANTNNVNDSPLFFITMSNFSRFYWYCPNGKHFYHGRHFHFFRILFSPIDFYFLSNNNIRWFIWPISKLLSNIFCSPKILLLEFFFNWNYRSRKWWVMVISRAILTIPFVPRTWYKYVMRHIIHAIRFSIGYCRQGYRERERQRGKKWSTNIDVKNTDSNQNFRSLWPCKQWCLIFLAFHTLWCCDLPCCCSSVMVWKLVPLVMLLNLYLISDFLLFCAPIFALFSLSFFLCVCPLLWNIIFLYSDT